MRGVGSSVRSLWSVAGRGRYEIGPGLLANHTLRLAGPGTIRVGADVNAWARSGSNVLRTFEPGARIEVGDRVRLNGAGLQSASRITIGDDSILASCTLVDTDHHGVDPASRHLHEGVRTAPITVGRNVWIVGGTMVLKGVTIGDDSIVGFGSVVTGDIPAGVLAAGRPARVVRRLRDDASVPLRTWHLAVRVGSLGAVGLEAISDRLRAKPAEITDVRVDSAGGIEFDLAAPDRLEAVRTAMRLTEEAAVEAGLGDVATTSVEIEERGGFPAAAGTPEGFAASHP